MRAELKNLLCAVGSGISPVSRERVSSLSVTSIHQEHSQKSARNVQVKSVLLRTMSDLVKTFEFSLSTAACQGNKAARPVSEWFFVALPR
jgi:hypothetical protein